MDVRPSTAYHSLPVKALGGLARTMEVLGFPPVELTEEALVAVARRETGLDRFGDEFFLPGLRELLKSLREEACLNPFGRRFAPKPIMRSLKNRLWANACFEAHPEILDRQIVAPVIVIGPIRSGTTRLQRMLAVDDRFQHLTAWEGFNPAPREATPGAGAAARRHETIKFLRMRQRLYPDADAGHPMDADWAEEEILLLNQSFSGLTPVGFYHIPGYCRWLLGHDRNDAYRYMADQMRLISWSRGDPETKPWVLKTPQHMLDLDVLVKVFPTAKFVFIHRDPVKTVASTLSLAWHLAVQNTDRPCRAQVRDVWFDLCEQMARRCIRARQALPAAQQIDVFYEEMNRDWRAVMRRIYHFCEMEFTPRVDGVMENWLAKSESENRHGRHRYSLDDFGVTPAEVGARMKFYRDQYAIPDEDVIR